MAVSYIGAVTASPANNPTSGSWAPHASWAAGDVLVVWWYTADEGKTITPPVSITPLQDAAISGRGRLFVGRRVLQGGDSTFGWTASSVATASTIWGSQTWRGVDGTTPVEAEGGPFSYVNTDTPTGPPVTPVSNDAAIVTIVGGNNDAGSASVAPTNYTLGGGDTTTLGSDATAVAAYRILSGGAGVEEVIGTWTLNISSTVDGMLWSGAFKPATVGGGARASLMGGKLVGRGLTLQGLVR
jgi:hypothetical protein